MILLASSFKTISSSVYSGLRLRSFRTDPEKFIPSIYRLGHALTHFLFLSYTPLLCLSVGGSFLSYVFLFFYFLFPPFSPFFFSLFVLLLFFPFIAKYFWINLLTIEYSIKSSISIQINPNSLLPHYKLSTLSIQSSQNNKIKRMFYCLVYFN